MSDAFKLSSFLPYRLAVLSERVSRRLTVEYERTHGLSVAEWRVLVHLGHHGRGSVREIHEWVNLDKPRVSRAVARLEAGGLVRKIQDDTDARLVVISLTPDGQAALGDILPAATRIEARLLDAIDDQDLEIFLKVVQQIHQTLDSDPQAKPRSRMELEQATPIHRSPPTQ